MILRHSKTSAAERRLARPNPLLLFGALAQTDFKADGAIGPGAMAAGPFGSAPVVLIEKTIHFIDDGRQSEGILLPLCHLLQVSPALGLIDSFHGSVLDSMDSTLVAEIQYIRSCSTSGDGARKVKTIGSTELLLSLDLPAGDVTALFQPPRQRTRPTGN